MIKLINPIVQQHLNGDDIEGKSCLVLGFMDVSRSMSDYFGCLRLPSEHFFFSLSHFSAGDWHCWCCLLLLLLFDDILLINIHSWKLFSLCARFCMLSWSASTSTATARHRLTLNSLIHLRGSISFFLFFGVKCAEAAMKAIKCVGGWWLLRVLFTVHFFFVRSFFFFFSSTIF